MVKFISSINEMNFDFKDIKDNQSFFVIDFSKLENNIIVQNGIKLDTTIQLIIQYKNFQNKKLEPFAE